MNCLMGLGAFCALLMYLIILGGSKGESREQDDLEQLAYLREYELRRLSRHENRKRGR